MSKSTMVPLDAKTSLDFVLEPAVEETSPLGAAPLIDVTSTKAEELLHPVVAEPSPVERNYAVSPCATPAVGPTRAPRKAAVCR